MRDSCLLLFTKAARPGRVKTRLIGAGRNGGGRGLTAEQAAELHAALLEDLVERLAPGRFDFKIAWALEDGEQAPDSPYPSLRQSGVDLGERLFRALKSQAASHRLLAAVGSDHPELSLAEIERGFSLLRGGVEVVLGPATDGGYYFVGTRRDSLRRELFDGIEWSTPTVLEATVDRCRDLSLSLMLLAEGADLDTPDDLEELVDRLGDPGRSSTPGPRTTRWLREWRSQ